MGTGLPNRECWMTNCWGAGGELGCGKQRSTVSVLARWAPLFRPTVPATKSGRPSARGKGRQLSCPLTTAIGRRCFQLLLPGIPVLDHSTPKALGFGAFCLLPGDYLAGGVRSVLQGREGRASGLGDAAWRLANEGPLDGWGGQSLVRKS